MRKGWLRRILVCCCLAIVLTAGGKFAKARRQEGGLQQAQKEYGRGQAYGGETKTGGDYEKYEKETGKQRGWQEEKQMDKERQNRNRETERYHAEKEGERHHLPGSGLWVPTVEEVSENPYIYRYNHELGKEKGLLDEDGLNQRYLCMQAVYRANLDAYLLERLDVRDLDEELMNSGLGFASRKGGDQNLYEKESTMGLTFIYLRNNLYIEYLGKDQLDLLAHAVEEGVPVTDEMKSMVEDTYREVIRVRNPRDWEDDSRFFYPKAGGSRPEISSYALVLGMANALKYDASGRLLPDAHRTDQYEYLERIKKEKEKEYSEILGTEVFILIE